MNSIFLVVGIAIILVIVTAFLATDGIYLAP